MRLRYSYNSAYDGNPRNRWFHFALFLGASFMLFLACWQFYLYITHWEGGVEPLIRHELLAIAYLVLGGLLALWGTRVRRAEPDEIVRYVKIDDDQIKWHLTQVDGEQTIPLRNIEHVDRRNIRDLVFTLNTGETIMLPIYLVGEEDKQDELMKVLYELIPGSNSAHDVS